jgi:uncharacterized protein YkwD
VATTASKSVTTSKKSHRQGSQFATDGRSIRMMDAAPALAVSLLAAVALAPGMAAQSAPLTLAVTLTTEPAAEYRTGEPLAERDGELAAEIGRRFPSLRFSSNLARAARELGTSWRGGSLVGEPNELITFLLHSSGCPDPSVLAAAVSSTSDDPDPVWERLAASLREAAEPPTDVGIARVHDPAGALPWRLVILLARRRFALQPLPRAVAPGAALRLTFSLAEGLRAPELVTVSPSGATQRTAVSAVGAGWEVTVVLGTEIGDHGVELLATDEHGPHVLALMPVSVGTAPPRSWRGEPPPSEAAIATVADAERYLRELTDRERSADGCPPLTWDDALAAVARAHSEDMRDHAFMGHVSPSSGNLSDRLQRAGYPFAYAAENISRSGSLWEAVASLMHSPAHRRNLLSPEVTRGGIGVAVVTDVRGERSYLVTQVLVRLPPGETSPR